MLNRGSSQMEFFYVCEVDVVEEEEEDDVVGVDVGGGGGDATVSGP